MRLVFALATLVGLALATTENFVSVTSSTLTFALLGECATNAQLTDLVTVALDYTSDGFNAVVSPGNLFKDSTAANFNATLFNMANVTGATNTEKTFNLAHNQIFSGMGSDDLFDSREPKMKNFTFSQRKWYHPGENYSVTVLDTVGHRVKLIFIDTTSLLHACDGGCSNTTTCVYGNASTAASGNCTASMTNVSTARVLWLRDQIKASKGKENFVFVVGSHPIISVGDSNINTTNTTWGYPTLRQLLLPVLSDLRPTAYIFGGHEMTQVLHDDNGVAHIGVGACIGGGTILGNETDLDRRTSPGEYKIGFNVTEKSITILKINKDNGASATVISNDGDTLYNTRLQESQRTDDDDDDDDDDGLWTGMGIIIALCVVVALMVGYVVWSRRREANF